MAPFRSSRSTRNFDQNAQRNRNERLDMDPMEGLPVTKWKMGYVTIKQDPEPDEDSQDMKSRGDEYPWPELPLPPFYSQLPAHSQEMLRRARMGNRTAELPTWDSKKAEWVYPQFGDSVDKAKALKSNGAIEGEDTEMIDEDIDDVDDDLAMNDGVDAPAVSKRKMNEPRAYTVRKWVPIPATEAEKIPERKYLSDRRPGMPSLYGVHGIGQHLYHGYVGQIGALGAANGVAAGVDLGDGSGLGDTSGLLGGQPTGISTPRKGPPPRKKKKKGGPGRKKAVPVEVPMSVDGVGPEAIAGTLGQENGTTGEHEDHDDHDEHKEGEDTGTESEEEGSEEGELRTDTPADVKMEPDLAPEAEPEPKSEQPAQPEPEAELQPEVEPEQEPTAAEPVVEEKTEEDLVGTLEAAVNQQVAEGTAEGPVENATDGVEEVKEDAQAQSQAQ